MKVSIVLNSLMGGVAAACMVHGAAAAYSPQHSSVRTNVFNQTDVLNQTDTSQSQRYLAQSTWNRTLSELKTYVDGNITYFRNYALQSANTIAEGGQVIWRAADFGITPDDGTIILLLRGYPNLGLASIFVTPPQMDLYLVFRPDECFRYRYDNYQLDVGGSFERDIRQEVHEALDRSKGAIENSLNREVSQTLSKLPAGPISGCN